MFRLSLFIGFLLLILATRFFFFYKDQQVYSDGHKLTLQTTLLSEPTHAGMYQKITARLPHGERVFISAPAYPEYTYGQKLVIKGIVQVKKVDRGEIYTMSYPKIAVLPTNNPFLQLITPIRARIIWLFETSLPQPAGNLLLGIVFGIQEGMPKEFDDMLQNAGVLHVVAASGMNVALIGGFLSGIFGRLLKRQYAVLLTIVAILFYTALAGFSASIVRASIMGILVFSAQIFGRQTLAFYGLLLAGFFMLLYQPFLLFDTGFQLSFMATWGLIMFNPLVARILTHKAWYVDLIAKSDFMTTFIAQLATLPILLGTFGSYSFVSILVNFMLLWTIPFLMIIGGIGACIGLFMPVVGQWVFYLALPFLFYFEAVVWFFGSMPLSLTVHTLSWPLVTGYYLLLVAFLMSSRALAKRSHSEIATSPAKLDPRNDNPE